MAAPAPASKGTQRLLRGDALQRSDAAAAQVDTRRRRRHQRRLRHMRSGWAIVGYALGPWPHSIAEDARAFVSRPTPAVGDYVNEQTEAASASEVCVLFRAPPCSSSHMRFFMAIIEGIDLLDARERRREGRLWAERGADSNALSE
eukprot:352114-Chlamydomonas_euryale.AAC.8